MQKIISAIAIVMLLASCNSKVKQKIGIEDVAPNERLVEKNRPLYVPPHYELPEPPAPELEVLETKKSSWAFWKRDKADPKIKVKSEEAQKPASLKKKLFWQKEKSEAKVKPAVQAADKADKQAAQPKKKYFWQREKRADAGAETK